jgi:hemolysin III
VLAIPPALAGATTLVVLARNNPVKVVTLAVYGAALVTLFTVSALYHRGSWSASARIRWRRADHATIFLMIAGTYTPVTATVLDGSARVALLTAIWVLALAGVATVVSGAQLPRAGLAVMYVAVGWTALWVLPQLFARVGLSGMAYLLGGAALYSAGAATYMLRRPRLWPRVFGYHEVFHLLVIAATALFFAFITRHVVLAAPG